MNNHEIPENLIDGDISTFYHSVADGSEKWIKFKVAPAWIQLVVIEDR